ncbi:MAG: methyltransferase domain-containing protein [Caldimonas sp.]
MNEPEPAGAGRRLDAVAVETALRRLSRRDQPAWLHSEVARRLAERLVPIRAEPGRILDWWAGPGGGAAALGERYPKAEIVAVEPDARWLDLRARRSVLPWWSFAKTQVAARSVADSDASLGRAQLVWANMVLHGIVDPPALLARWHGLLGVDGLVAFSCLGPGTLRELRELYTAAGWPAPTPGFIDMHDLGDMLVAAGFADPVLDQETLTLSWPSPEALLAELRQLGGNAAPDRFAALRTPAWRRRLLGALAERADAEGRIALSFEVAYGHGFKAAPRVREGSVAVSLDDMRRMVGRPPSGPEGVR